MSTTLSCQDLRMNYGGGGGYVLGDEQAGVSFEVAEGELFALLGPSGCGKTTTLRIVGGFVKPSTGSVLIDGVDVTSTAPYGRPTNTVFQSYALFPHKNVAENVAFGLRIKGVKGDERRRRVAAALDMVGLGGLGDRRVDQLSGGQAQRAALARALVNRPSVLLLDEPLGALDLKLRRQMQDEIARVKQETRTSFVHVTHDQEEACAIADRIAVMDRGHIVQIASPVELYRAPATSYVAEFIGAGAVIRGRARRSGDVCEITAGALTVRGAPAPHLAQSTQIAAVLPPHRTKISPLTARVADHDNVEGTIERVTFTGTAFDCHVRVSDEVSLRASMAPSELQTFSAMPAHGERVTAYWRPSDVIFVGDTEPATREAAS